MVGEETYRGDEKGEPLIRENYRPEHIPFVQTYVFPKQKVQTTEVQRPKTPPVPIADQLLEQLDHRVLLEKKRLIQNDMQHLQVTYYIYLHAHLSMYIYRDYLFCMHADEDG